MSCHNVGLNAQHHNASPKKRDTWQSYTDPIKTASQVVFSKSLKEFFKALQTMECFYWDVNEKKNCHFLSWCQLTVHKE